MHVTLRKYEGVDPNRIDELTKKIDDSLMPRLSKLPGFSEYFLVEAGHGVMTSIGIFDTMTHGSESTRVAAEWVREEKLQDVLPNPPKVTDGEVIAYKSSDAVAVV